jgi:hypothetical protein
VGPWADVASDGSIVRSSTPSTASVTVTAQETSSGKYVVDFGEDIRGCSYESVVVDPWPTSTAFPAAAFVSVAGQPGTVSSAFVSIIDLKDENASSPFALSLSC